MKVKKGLNILLIISLILTLFNYTPVYAANATVGFDSDSTVKVGDEITVTLYLSNITTSSADDGINTIGGNLSFDSEYLEYVSGAGIYSGYTSNTNPDANYKFGGFGNPIRSSGKTNIFEFVFRAKKAGTTMVSIESNSNYKVTDKNGKITPILLPKAITIVDDTATTPTKSSDATLRLLDVTGFDISPEFTSSNLNYTLTVPEGTNEITITAAANHGKATVQGEGTLELTESPQMAAVKVIAEDGTEKTYTIRVVKESGSTPGPVEDEKSSDADLLSLSASGYTLSPEFNKDRLNYVIKVPESATYVKLIGEASSDKASITGLGNVNLTGDSTSASVVVTAEDGTTKTYTIRIDKTDINSGDKDSDATLKSLDLSGYTLSPVFNKDVNTYSIKVQNTVSGLRVTAIPNSENADVEITGNTGWVSGVNVVRVKVTAEDGTVNTYIINVTKADDNETGKTKSSNNLLDKLTINSSHEISPEFDSNISSYNVKVPYTVSKLNLSYITADSKAKVDITSTDDLKVGEVNVVEITVTAEDGSIRTYTLNVTRLTDNSENDLKKLTVTGTGTKSELFPKFDPDILEYSITVDGNTDKLNLDAIAESTDSTVEVIGNNNLKEGHNTILIKVIDKNGFTKYYTIDVLKEAKASGTSALSSIQFGLLAAILSLFALLLLIIVIILLRRKDKEENKPVIEVKPEFNFGSKNSSDDDTVYGNMNQNSKIKTNEPPKEIEGPQTIEADYDEIESKMPNDPFDETVTKTEIIEAIKEARDTKDTSKLKMLLEQEELNKKRKKMRESQNKEERD